MVGDLENTMSALLALCYVESFLPNVWPSNLIRHSLKRGRFLLNRVVTSPYNRTSLSFKIYHNLFAVNQQSISHCVSSCHCFVKPSGVKFSSGGSDGRRGVALFGSDPGHVLQLAGVGHVVARLVLGEDFHEWTELQPPLLLRDPVAERTKDKSFYEELKRLCGFTSLSTQPDWDF